MQKVNFGLPNEGRWITKTCLTRKALIGCRMIIGLKDIQTLIVSTHQCFDRFFERNGFDFVPYYEKHDLKHVLLGYDAAAPEEMCMQAFMFGNAGFRPFIKLFTIIFLIWTPDAWRELPYHFLIGRFTKPIGGLRVEDLAHRDLQAVRNEIGLMEAI